MNEEAKQNGGGKTKMSRSGYTDDCESDWGMICWRGAVKAAIRGAVRRTREVPELFPL